MSKQNIDFGYLPQTLDVVTGDIAVSTLPDLLEKVAEVEGSGLVEREWIYSPPVVSKDFMSGVERELPYKARVFSLPNTHTIAHNRADGPEHLSYLVWMLGFIMGMRLTDAEAGFVDATPVKPGKLHDIVWFGKSEPKALAAAEAFWQKHKANPRIPKGLCGIVHSLFMSETPTHFDFEKFILLYVAFDGCFFVWKEIHRRPSSFVAHRKRIAVLCKEFGRDVPTWAGVSASEVAGIRNETLHEGLFFNEPLGFQIYRGSPTARASYVNVLLEMQGLLCRFICALLELDVSEYIESDVGTRQQHGVRL